MAILGNSTYYAAAYPNEDRAPTVKITPTGDCTMDSIVIYMHDLSAPGSGRTFQYGCWNSSFVKIYQGSLWVSGSNWSGWKTRTCSVELTGGQDYYIGNAIPTNSYGNTYVHYQTVGAGANTADETPFSSGTTLANLDLTTRPVSYWCIYANVTYAPPSGPAILIEGITPAEVNTVEWGNISTIK